MAGGEDSGPHPGRKVDRESHEGRLRSVAAAPEFEQVERFGRGEIPLSDLEKIKKPLS